MNLKSKIRTIMHFPKQGIGFKDITTLLLDAGALRKAVDEMAAPFKGKGITKIVGIESRGFIFGMPMAYAMTLPFVPIRKPGKLPAEKASECYELEYGKDSIEVHCDAITRGDRVLLVDDLIATGGTAEAACVLIEKMGGKIVECCFIIDLPDIGGRARLEKHGQKVFALCEFEGD